MCGIAGIIQLTNEKIHPKLCARLSQLLAHRGPDDEGFLLANMSSGEYQIFGGADTPQEVYSASFPFTPKVPIHKAEANHRWDLALINRRLAIVDLSPAGHLPMSCEDHSIWLAYNGQIYNFVELRNELQQLGHRFLSKTDSEVILKAYKTWGTRCFHKFNGMWAIVIWDVPNKKIILSRDRFGIKPLYYWYDGNIFAFASEIKCLLELGAPRIVHEGLVYDYLTLGLLDHTNETFFERIKKLPPAHFLEFHREERQLRLERFWDFDVSEELYSQEECDEKYTAHFRELFTDAVRLRLRSDVPVGSCLSGGLDSSSIVTVANNLILTTKQQDAQGHQKTFSACFDDRRFDEREYIQEVLQATGAEAHYVFPRADQFLSELEDLIWHQEEPFRSSSIYAQWCVMRHAREHGVIVMLDGQGGDELLCGYRKFYLFYFKWLLRRDKVRLLSEFIRFASSWEILKTLNILQGMRYIRGARYAQGIYTLLQPEFRERHVERVWPLSSGGLGQRIKADITQFSLPVLLRYEDKNSMAHSVEARLPFLDYRLVEMVSSIPLDQKIRHGWTKYILRQALKDVLPEKIRLRKSKLGFATPEDDWFKRDLSSVIRQVFESPLFLNHYVHIRKLQDLYTKYQQGRTLYTSEFFFRFFILELWGRCFIIGQKPLISLRVKSKQ
ncbi:MAG: asparagine synthase (glutamine-hydrolyzing) [Candidatus Caldarchaeum sp.]